MRLPGAEQAWIEPAKIRDYLLRADHPVGGYKEVFFAKLGYSRENWAILADDLRRLAMADAAKLGDSTRYGEKYEVHGIITGPSGRSASVLSVWIVRRGERFPRFVTAFPGEKR